jgi:hypothetical protein
MERGDEEMEMSFVPTEKMMKIDKGNIEDVSRVNPVFSIRFSFFNSNH